MKLLIITIRITLGLLFIYAGINKFVPQEPKTKPSTEQVDETTSIPDHVLKIRSYIGGLKQTGYFWPMLGMAEILCGLLLVSQVFSLLGAVMLVPITLNIFLFEVFLGGGNIIEVITHGLYLVGNLLIIAYGFARLKIAFLTTDKQFQKVIRQ